MDGEQYNMQVVVNPNYRATSAVSRPTSVRGEEDVGDEDGEGSADVLDRGYSKVSFLGTCALVFNFNWIEIAH